MRTLLFFVLILLSVPLRAFASPVISEVMWMGTGLGPSDEWLEILNPDAEDADLSGWTVTSVNSSGKEVVSFLFATGAVIPAGEYLVIASKSAGSSRLLQEPFGVSSTLSLPNTKLLLRLRDAAGTVMDEVDDGVGTPFAGENPSGTEGKASMERIDPAALGTVKENWRSAEASQGFDPEAGDKGTPGFTSVFEEEEESDPGPDLEEDPESGSDPEPTICFDPLEIAIAVQSGPLVATGKATVNFQAVATEGSLSGVVCSWVFSDGYSSQSCNPPAHSFVTPGTHIVRLEAKNKCGNTLTQEQIVEVMPEPGSGNSGSQQSVWYDGSRLILMAALPNPEGTDTDKEWIEIKNPEEKPVDLRGWKLKVGETSVKSYALTNVIAPGETLKIFNSELSFTLPNTASKVSLVTPSGLLLSTIPWASPAEEGRRYFSDDLKQVTVRGTVVSIHDSLSFVLELSGEAATVLGKETVHVRIPGLYSLDESKGYEFLRDLMENEIVELQCSSDMWDSEGALQADALMQDSTSAVMRMTSTKYWTKDSALIKDVKNESKMYSDSGSFLELEVHELRLTEVYASPFPKTSSLATEDWKTNEWLEIENSEQYTVDLTGWKIRTVKSEKSLPLGLKVESGSRIMIDVSSMKLALRNAGDTVHLVAPDNTVVSSMTYPKLKNGMSYATSSEGFCETIEPTPGAQNACTMAPVKVAKAKVTKPKSAVVPKASARVRSYAASYRAQVDSETVDQNDILIPNSHSVHSSRPMAIGAFLIGFGLPLLLFFLYNKASALRAYVERWRAT